MPPNIEAPTTSSTGTFITERQFQDYIKRGDSVFIYENKVYKVNNFKYKHPGGLAAIACGLGKDATDDIRAFHPPKVYQSIINLYYIGDYLPSLKSNTNKNKSRKPKRNQNYTMRQIVTRENNSKQRGMVE
jgi:delta8-fatty-acid desaturase